MNTFKKMIFLSNKDNPQSKAMGILILEKKNNTFCTLKLFNYSPANDLVLGIKSDNKIIKQNIILSGNSYNFLLNQDFNISKDIGCVLLECDKNNFNPILWGNEKNVNYKNQIVQNLKSSIEKLKLREIKKESINISKKETENTYESKFIEDTINPINSKDTINSRNNIYNINNYKDNIDAFAQISMEEELLNPHQDEIAQSVKMEALFDSSDEEIEKTIDKEMYKTEHKFYNMIAEQLDELFDKFPREHNLENLIENSKWVKINHEEENKYYVVGIINVDQDIKYICYGVPGSYYNEPPRELLGYSQWLPTDTLNPYENGYWVMYQDADSGDNVHIH